MRLSISNLAWDVAEDDAVATLLQRHGIDAIDVAPGKYFPRPAEATAADLARVKGWWAARGVELTGMQALLFGTTGLNLFGPEDARAAMLQHLGAVCRVGGGLGATRVVFGSPKNRDRGALNDREAAAVAVPFFRRLGDLAQASGVVVCLEPNPTSYGANFMTTSAETALIVEQVAHPAIAMQLDTGALTITREDPLTVLREHGARIGHVHASEPDLLPLGAGGTDHARVAALLEQHLPHHVVTIEMVATRAEPHPVSIERALGVAIQHYRPAAPGRQR